MKQTFSLLAVLFSFIQLLPTSLDAKQTSVSKQPSIQQQERAILLRNCSLITAEVNEYFTRFGAYSSSARTRALSDHISQYLLSIGTPVARQLLSELSQRNFEV